MLLLFVLPDDQGLIWEIAVLAFCVEVTQQIGQPYFGLMHNHKRLQATIE